MIDLSDPIVPKSKKKEDLTMKFLILFIIAMLISSIGFKKFVWFISLFTV